MLKILLLSVLFLFQNAFSSDFFVEIDKNKIFSKASKYSFRSLLNYSKKSTSKTTFVDKNLLLDMPEELKINIFNFLNNHSLLNLRYGCKAFYNILSDDFLKKRIPKYIIHLFPDNSLASNIILGYFYYEYGVENNKKKLIKKSAKLGHKEAIKWLCENHRNKQKINHNSTYIIAPTFPGVSIPRYYFEQNKFNNY